MTGPSRCPWVGFFAIATLVVCSLVMMAVFEDAGHLELRYYLYSDDSLSIDIANDWKARQVEVHIPRHEVIVSYSIDKPTVIYSEHGNYTRTIEDSPPFPGLPYNFVSQIDIGRVYRDGFVNVDILWESESKDPVTMNIGGHVFETEIGKEVSIDVGKLASTRNMFITFRRQTDKSIKGTLKVIKKRPFYTLNGKTSKACDFRQKCIVELPYRFMVVTSYDSEHYVTFNTININYWSNFNWHNFKIVSTIMVVSVVAFFLSACVKSTSMGLNK